MPKEYSRNRRVGHLLRTELAEVLRESFRLPGGGMVTVAEVDVARDLRNAKVYFTVLGGTLETGQVRQHLQEAAGALRYELAHRVNLRVTPRLHFVYDTSTEHGAHVSALLNSVLPPKSE